MAFRRPYFYNGGYLQEMSDSHINDIRVAMYWRYISNPSVALNVVGSGGNLGTYYDTRMQAGNWANSATAYPSPAATQDISIVTVAYSRIQQDIASVSNADTSNIRYPLYYDGSDMRAMSLQDFNDTFTYTVIDWLSQSDAVYTVTSYGGGVSGYTFVNGYPIYSDTRADVSNYIYYQIPEAIDQPITAANYYLLRRNSGYSYYQPPALANSSGNIYTVDTGVFDTTLYDAIRNCAANDTNGYKLRYNINGAGNNCGSGMTDTRLNGAGAWNTYYVNTDDYRAQEFPNGTAVAVGTYYLRTGKA